MCASIMGDVSLVLNVDNLDNSTLPRFYDTPSNSTHNDQEKRASSRLRSSVIGIGFG